MKKILLLGGSHRDIPLIKAAQELGYFVITLGDRDYYLGHRYSDAYYKTDFNNLQAVKEIIKKENIDFLLPGCGEESYLKTVELSQVLGIGNFDTLQTAQLVHNKWAFKTFCLANDISTPKGFYYKGPKDLENIAFPAVVKPTNLSGGRGVEVVYNRHELTEALDKANKVSDEIFIEKFIDGELIAYSVFIKEQKIAYGFTGKDDTYLNKYLISSAYPVGINPAALSRLKKDIEKLARLLSLVDGMFHLQVIIQDETPYLIDVTRRIPGDLYPYLIEFCDKVAYSKAVVKSYIGLNITDEFKSDGSKSFVIRHCIMPSANGILQDIHIDPSLKDKIIYRLDLMPKGTMIEDFLHAQIAIVFIELNETDEKVISNINNLIYPILDPKDI